MTHTLAGSWADVVVSTPTLRVLRVFVTLGFQLRPFLPFCYIPVADLEGAEHAPPPPPPLGDGLTPSLPICVNGAALWRHHRQFISSNTSNVVLRIFKMIATSGFLTALGCSIFVFVRGSAPYLAWGAYSAPPFPLAGLRGLLIRGREKRKRKGREGDRPPYANSWIRPVYTQFKSSAYR